MIIPFPGSSSLPAPLTRALADEGVPASLREALRDACSDDEEDRLVALDALHAGLTLADLDAATDDGDGDGEYEEGADAAPAALRLFPALVALAGLREGAERLALLGVVSGLEMIRLAGELDVPEDLGDDWEEAHATALRLCAEQLTAVVDEEVLRPLLSCVATLQGDVMLGSAIAAFDDDVDGDVDEDLDEEGADDGDNA